MINHHGDWNYKKTMKIDIQEAKRKYVEKRNHFIGLSISFKDRVTEWQNMPRKTYKEGKEALSRPELRFASISEGEVMEVIVGRRHASQIRLEAVGARSRLGRSYRHWGIVEPSSNEASEFKGFRQTLYGYSKGLYGAFSAILLAYWQLETSLRFLNAFLHYLMLATHHTESVRSRIKGSVLNGDLPIWKVPCAHVKLMFHHSRQFATMIAEDDNFASTLIPKNQIARFLDRGLRIQDSQRKIRHLIEDTAEHDLQSRQKEITTRTSKLRVQLVKFRQDQKRLMGKMNNYIFLPIRQQMDLVKLGAEEVRWREGQAFDILRALQNVVRAISAMRKRKSKNERQQKQNSRAGDHIEEATKRQERHIESYKATRDAIISMTGSSNFLALTEADLFMKQVQEKRRVGDSKQTDGLLWRAKTLGAAGTYHQDGDINMRDLDEDLEKDAVASASVSGTQMDRRKSGPRPRTKGKEPQKQVPERPEGWLWQLGKSTKMSDAEMDAWSAEVQALCRACTKICRHGRLVTSLWFLAAAEMQRWQEQGEQKLVESLRTARSFAKMQSVWSALANNQPSLRAGAKAYARQQAAMYEKRTTEGHKKLKDLGYGELLGETANVVLFVEQQRRKEAEFIQQTLS
ncbi:hypothetical protein B0H13DRAFT_1852515 [Mycena leptocephala]|nr:hypothetical protein B0H13DRAFT_1852515 [Mycena leptocephala]